MSQRLERLMNLVALLLEARRALSIDEVLERVPGYPEDRASARRQFERDKETLRGIGVPVRTEVSALGGDTGYLIDRDEYALGDLRLTPAEQAALHLAVTAVRLEGSPGIGALAAIGGAEGDPVAAVAEVPTLPALPTLFDACTARSTVQFVHRSTRRTLDPWGLLFRRGHWYVVGLDHDRGEPRSFRVDRIEGAVEAGPPGAFEPPPGAEPAELVNDAPWQFGDDGADEHVARLLVSAKWAGVIIEQLGEEAVAERRGDGSVVVTFRVSNPAAFRSFVLDLLDDAEVLEPPELRNAVTEWLAALARA